jgi:hypothetical protein
MTDKHEPDPRFVDSLEWQLGRELRRRKADAVRRPAFRRLKIAGLVLGSVALGAAAMAASQQIQDSWRRELLESRLEVQLRLAQQRLDMQRVAIGSTRERVEQGFQTDRELAQFELQITEAEADVTTLELKLEEIRRSGREPLDELSSPLVGGRDFVSERIGVRIDVAARHLDVVRRASERTRRQVEIGIVNQRELLARQLLTTEAELQVATLAEQLEVRRAFLDSEISAVEAELESLDTEAANRVVLLDRQRQYFQVELERMESLIEAGVIRPAEAAAMRAQLAEIETALDLADQEQRIVRDELERRAAQR